MKKTTRELKRGDRIHLDGFGEVEVLGHKMTDIPLLTRVAFKTGPQSWNLSHQNFPDEAVHDIREG